MSHSRERSEKICLNCNTEISGRFCHVCGQENIDPRESIWSIITHFFNDITHFDGKFFTTVGLLITKPGFLPLEFIKGRRVRYLHPIRLYIFTSAVFFLVFYAFWKPDPRTFTDNTKQGKEFYDKHAVPSREIKPGEIPSPGDVILNPLDTITAVFERENNYKSVAEYDSIQKSLPAEDRDGWISRRITKGFIERSDRYGKVGMFSSILDNFIHTFPYLLFVSLPVCAFFLQMLYFRNKNNLFAGNAIFLVYLYVFTFLMLLIYFLIDNVESAYQLRWMEWLKILLFLYIAYYTAKAMKRFYAQGRGVTIFKFIIFIILSFFAIIFLFILFFLLSLLKV